MFHPTIIKLTSNQWHTNTTGKGCYLLHNNLKRKNINITKKSYTDADLIHKTGKSAVYTQINNKLVYDFRDCSKGDYIIINFKKLVEIIQWTRLLIHHRSVSKQVLTFHDYASCLLKIFYKPNELYLHIFHNQNVFSGRSTMSLSLHFWCKERGK